MLMALGLKVLGWLGSSAFGGLVSDVTDVIKNSQNAEVLKDKAGAEIAVRYLTAVNDTNQIKAKTQTERTVMWGLLGFALPTMIVWWAALMDGIPFYLPLLMDAPHRRGSWSVAVPPEFLADYHTIVQSFFIAAPTLAGVAMLARAFSKN